VNSKVLIIGAGAIGAFYGALLAKTGAEVSVVCRSDYSYVKHNGYQIRSETLGTWTFKPNLVLQSIHEFLGTPDYVILCTKVLPTLDRAALIRPVVGINTAIVFIQNGIDIEHDIQRSFPGHDIISGLAYICCNRVKPGEVHHLAFGRIILGDVSGILSDKTFQLCEAFKQAGIDSDSSDHIVTDRWIKCIWNAPFNSISVLSGGLPTLSILRTQEPLVRQVMQDVYNIAKAAGHSLPEEIIDEIIANTYLMPPYKTSMLADYERGQPMEVEAIIGNTLRAGIRVKQSCPYIETIYGLLKLYELKLLEQHVS
jgi:2-dehydropantoate 2-reductase